jgi:hypothetical protein
LPLVHCTGSAANKASSFKTIDQAHGAVMAKEQALCKPADAGCPRIGKPADNQEHLVLLRFEAGGLSRVIAATEKLANTITEFG